LVPDLSMSNERISFGSRGGGPQDDRTLCRACAGAKYYLPVSCVALAFLLLSLSSVAFAQQQRANERPAACDNFAKVQVPTADLPTPEERKALASCNSYDLYFGFDHPADPVKARKCAYLEREPGTVTTNPNPVFSGAGLLTMIYANGKGAARNFDLALKFACESDGTEDIRVEHLLKLKDENWTGDDFDLCDDQSTTLTMNWCVNQGSDEGQPVRAAEASAITEKWTAAEKTAFRELQKAATASFEASTQNEVDLSGTIRTVSMFVVDISLNNDFLAALQRFEKGQLPKFTALEFSKVDAELNSLYSKLQSDPKNSAYEYTTLTPEGVKIAQRAWLRYREAWVKFGHVKYPSVTPESWRTWLTQERVEILKDLPRNVEP
jgi:uncharacterized protein YecT (DUF1311 family)